jgi:hypothetical protein
MAHVLSNAIESMTLHLLRPETSMSMRPGGVPEKHFTYT